MTISTTTSSVTIAGNGSTTVFSFPFVADNPSTIQVTLTTASGSTVLNPSVYTLLINPASPGQLWGIGGTVTYPNTGSPPTPIPVGDFITIQRDVPYTQTVSIGNQSAFYPQAVEQGLDLLELQIQQILTGITGFGSADPTALAGPVAVNGTAPTFMTSDSAPAIQLGTTAQKGIVQADGTTISISNGVISAAPSASTGNLSGRNRTINGNMEIDQRYAGTSVTFTAAANPVYTVDRWYGSCSGANITGQQSAGTAPYQYCWKFTGAASNTGTLFGQRHESYNVADMVSRAVCCQVQLASSSLTTVTWTAYYANSTDVWTSKTQIATGSITINGTPTVYDFTFNAGSHAANGIAIEFTTGALLATQTLQYSGVQFELGAVNTPYEYNSFGSSLEDCQRYFETMYDYGQKCIGLPTPNAPYGVSHFGIGSWCCVATNVGNGPLVQFVTKKRVAPSLTISAGWYYSQYVTPAWSMSTITNSGVSTTGFALQMTNSNGLVSMILADCYPYTNFWYADAEL